MRRSLSVVLAISIAFGAAALGTGSAGAAEGGGGAADAAGVINFPFDLTAQGGFRLDPIAVASPNDWWAQQFIYDSLLRQNIDGSYSPGLAKSATVVDAQTIDIELQPNVKFSDGTPMNADAVKFSLERTMASGNIGAVRAELLQIASITVNSPTKLTIALKTPIAGQFYNLLANGETFVVSPTAVQSGTPLNEKPVGAGPFTLESYTPERSAKFVKNPNYFQAKKIKVGGVELKQVAGTDPQATVNALLDHQVDATSASLALDQVPPLEAGGFTIVSQASDSSLILGPLCKSKPPFDNIKVRQALNYATDRDEINDLIYQGTSEPLWAFWTQSSKLFNPKLKDYYAHNVKKAKKLLKEAGAEGLTFDWYAGPTVETQNISTILKEQWAEAGITANLVNFTNIVQEFFTEQKAPGGVTPLMRAGLDKVTRNFLLGSIGDFCNYDDPKLNALVDQVRQLDASSKEYQQAWYAVDDYITKNALQLLLIWKPTINAYDPDRLANVVYRPDVFGVPRIDVYKTYIKK